VSNKKVEIRSDENHRFTQDPLSHLGGAPRAAKEPWICGQPLPPGAVGPPGGQNQHICRGDVFWLVPMGRELNSHCAICHAREEVPVMRVAGGTHGLNPQGAMACAQGHDARFRLFEAGGDLYTQCEHCGDWQPLGAVMLQKPK
jgi:hypothetical protein